MEDEVLSHLQSISSRLDKSLFTSTQFVLRLVRRGRQLALI